MVSMRALAFVIMATTFISLSEGNVLREDLFEVLEAVNELEPVWEDFVYDILLLAEQWAPSTCIKLGTKCAIPDTMPAQWSLHGLWPAKQGKGDSPHHCTADTFDAADIRAVRPQLNLRWPSISTTKTSEVFWSDEYTKHGTCASDIAEFNSQSKYFVNTLSLYSRNNLRKILADASITPSDTATYTLPAIRKALKDELKVDVQLHCHFESTTKTQYLWEIRLCYTRAQALVNCQKPGPCVASKKYPRIKYLPFPPRAPPPPGFISQCLAALANFCSAVWNNLPGEA